MSPFHRIPYPQSEGPLSWSGVLLLAYDRDIRRLVGHSPHRRGTDLGAMGRLAQRREVPLP